MSNRIRTTNQDLWIIDDVEYGVSEVSADGIVLIEVAGQQRARSFSFDQLTDLLGRGEADLKRDYFAPETAACALNSPVEFFIDLDRELQRLVLWRLAYVEAFVAREERSEVARTVASVNGILAELEREVDAQEIARQRLTKKAKRAGVKAYKRTAPSCSTLLEWVRRWEKSGQDPRSLIPRTHRSGNRRSRIPTEVEALISEGIQRYASFQRPTIRQTAADVVGRVKALNRKRQADGKRVLPIPSKRTGARRIKKLDPFATYAQRFGAAAANRKFGAYEDGIKASFPMERIEIDEWKVDVITLLEDIGALDAVPFPMRDRLRTTRLWLYLGICCATRCIVGMHLADQPNGADAIRLLSLITRDKSDLARAAGCESPWHHGGGLGLISSDQGGAFIDTQVKASIATAAGQFVNAVAGVPEMRSRVERCFGTFSTQIMPLLAGRTFSNPQERGDYPSEDLAVHTRETLMRILTIHVVDIYHNSPHRGLGGETPADCWERLSAKMGTLPYPSAIQRTAIFGVETERKLTGRGVSLYGINYVCGFLRERHKRAGEEMVRVRSNPEDLGFVMVWTGKAWVQARAIQNCFEGVSLGHWRQASRELRLRHAERAELKQGIVERALRKVEEINAEQIAKFNVTIPFLTPDQLAREKRQLHLGLTIRPQDQPSLDLPKSPDTIGSEVPFVDRAPDLFNQPDQEDATQKDYRQSITQPKAPTWGMEEDE